GGEDGVQHSGGIAVAAEGEEAEGAELVEGRIAGGMGNGLVGRLERREVVAVPELGPGALHGEGGLFLGSQGDFLGLGFCPGGDHGEGLAVVNDLRPRPDGWGLVGIPVAVVACVISEAAERPGGEAPGEGGAITPIVTRETADVVMMAGT